MTNTTRPAEEDGGNGQTIYAFTTYAEAELRLTDSDVVIATVRPGQHAIAMRLAAAWNACAGVSTADLAARRAAPGAATAAQSHSCWSCEAPVTAEERTAADGNCPHCGVELDDELWPARAAQAQGGK